MYVSGYIEANEGRSRLITIWTKIQGLTLVWVVESKGKCELKIYDLRFTIYDCEVWGVSFDFVWRSQTALHRLLNGYRSSILI